MKEEEPIKPEKNYPEGIEKIAWKVWEEDQKTNPSAVNPHAFVYGFKLGHKVKMSSGSKPESVSLEEAAREEIKREIFDYQSEFGFNTVFDNILDEFDRLDKIIAGAKHSSREVELFKKLIIDKINQESDNLYEYTREQYIARDDAFNSIKEIIQSLK